MIARLRSERGQTFILVMTVTALATVLGVMAMSGALMSVRLKSMHRMTDKNFYRLELAVEEIRAGVARDVSDAYRMDPYDWQTSYLKEHVGILDLAVLEEENEKRMRTRKEAADRTAGEYLAGFSLTLPVEGSERVVTDRTEEVSVKVGGVKRYADAVVFHEVEFILINYERDVQTSISCDLIVRPQGTDGSARIGEVVSFADWRRIG